ncbi:hypothetical protein C5167_031463 [Papaver somniferum]|uniref:Transferase n=1 Tax=Papaver somniferum TaxID=3469 RepID=A0A4Y7K8F2_PAPSO|nr:salutaridinol 7-O-acetyltransferase-like [Papaver somniferum]RZC68209.1 hypothetical protein C5167_031463 [Papaver somniferum]
MEVEVISNENIKPSSPTDHDLKTFKLSSLDQYRPSEYIPIILFYNPDPTDTNNDSISDHLKKSLSNTLTRFYPIAGRIKDNTTWVDCTDEGVEYIETRINGKVSDFTWTSELLHQLVPVHTNLATVVPAVIQVNFFDGGGIAITVCISHKIGDTSTYATFINSWAATARGVPAASPTFVSQTLFPISAPATSDTDNDQRGFHRLDDEENEDLVTKRLVFDGEKVSALRERIGDTLTTLKYPTRVEAVSALLWKSAMEAGVVTSPPAAKDQKPEPVSEMYIVVNVRKKMDPPLSDSSFGNIFSMATAKATITSGGVDLDDLVGRIWVAISGVDRDHIKRMQNDEDCEEDDEGYEYNDYWLMSWCNFSLYEIDFGFGKPDWVTTDAVEVLDENDIYLMDTKAGKGVEAWIKLKQEKMDMFLSNQELLEFATVFD